MEYHIKTFLSKNGRDVSKSITEVFNIIQSGDVLNLDGEKLDIYPQNTQSLFFAVSNNDSGIKNIAFLLQNKENVTIDGNGADLIFHGDVSPFVVDDCKSIVVKNLSVDYKYPMFAQAKIITANEEYTDLYFDNDQFCAKVKDGRFCFYNTKDGWENTDNPLVTEMDSETIAPMAYQSPYFPITGEIDYSDFLSVLMYKVRLEQLDDNTIRMVGKLPYTHTVGNYWVATHGGRKNSAFLINHSKDVKLNNVRIFCSVGMGVVGQTSHNISLDEVVMAPREGSGRMLSTNADASHFINCSGKISLNKCKFVSMMDDCCNIHGNYMYCKEKINKNKMVLAFGHFQQQGVLVFREGDVIRFFKKHERLPYQLAVVKSVRMLSLDAVEITTADDLPEEFEAEHLVENYSRMPEVHISNSEFGNNRPRGLLISTNKRTVIENCKFYNMNAAIQIGGEMEDWYESGSVEDVVIRNNDFCNSAYAGDFVLDFAPRNVKNLDSFVHSNILVENNVFTMNDRRFLKAAYCKNLRFFNNHYVYDKTLPKHGDLNDGISTEKMFDCIIEQPMNSADLSKN